jgi:hypothetical protein
MHEIGTSVPTFFVNNPMAIAVLSAELLFLISRKTEILILIKKNSQRTEEEKAKYGQGLYRILFAESMIVVPASLVLFRLCVFPIVCRFMFLTVNNIEFVYSTMGVVSYGFQFVSMTKWIEKILSRNVK